MQCEQEFFFVDLPCRSLAQRRGLLGHQVWSHLQAGLSPGLTRVLHGHQLLACGPLRLAEKQAETLLVIVKFGNNCETEIRGSNNDRLNVR